MIDCLHLKECFSNYVFLQVEENQVKHAENTEGTFEITSLFQIIIENNSLVLNKYECI